MVSGLGYEVSNPMDLKNREYDVAVDCSGNGRAMEAALGMLAPRGRFCIFGVADPKTKISIEPYQVDYFNISLRFCSRFELKLNWDLFFYSFSKKSSLFMESS